MEVAKTDMQKIIAYLDDAAKLYDALATLPMQKCNSRSHMIKQLNRTTQTSSLSTAPEPQEMDEETIQNKIR